jgi:hypothetical protein
LGQEHRRAYDAGFTGNFNYLGHCGGRYLYSTHRQPEGAEAPTGAVEAEIIGQNAIGHGRIHRVSVGCSRLPATLARIPHHLPLSWRGARCVVLAALLGYFGISPPIGKNKEVAMKKWILICFAAFLLIVVGVVVFSLSRLGPIIKAAVNTYGPEITKTDVKLGDVNLSLLSGQAKLKNFYLGNPKGFRSPDAMKVGSILVDVDENTLIKETIIIKRIEVIRPQITYERNARTDNFQAILNNITQSAKSSKPTSAKSQSAKSAGNKKIIIKDFQLKGGQVKLAASLLGQEKSLVTQLPDIHLTDIGEKKGGIKPEEAFRLIFAELSKYINSPDVMKAFSAQLKELKLDPKLLEGTTPEDIKDVGNKLKNLLGN